MVIALLVVIATLPGMALTAYGLGLKTGLDERRRFTFGSAPSRWWGRARESETERHHRESQPGAGGGR